jgi:MFS transporter, SP family, general alpha glucoside:H+ symporter
MAISGCLIMEGYDLVIINSFFGQDAFIHKFGILDELTGKKSIPSAWQSGLSNAALCGEIIGLGINGWASERFGYRRTLMVSLAVMACTIFTPVFAPSLPILALGEVLQGIPWGVFQTLTTAFAVEICPQTLRHYMSTWVCACVSYIQGHRYLSLTVC